MKKENNSLEQQVYGKLSLDDEKLILNSASEIDKNLTAIKEKIYKTYKNNDNTLILKE